MLTVCAGHTLICADAVPLGAHVQWEGLHFKVTAVYAPGDPGFTVHMTFNHEEDYSAAIRQISMCWPQEVTAAVIAALDETLGFRPLAARGT